MVTRAGWQRPGCARFLSPDVQVCPCSDGGAGVLARVRPLGDGGAGSYKVTGQPGIAVTAASTTVPIWTGTLERTG